MQVNKAIYPNYPFHTQHYAACHALEAQGKPPTMIIACDPGSKNPAICLMALDGHKIVALCKDDVIPGLNGNKATKRQLMDGHSNYHKTKEITAMDNWSKLHVGIETQIKHKMICVEGWLNGHYASIGATMHNLNARSWRAWFDINTGNYTSNKQASIDACKEVMQRYSDTLPWWADSTDKLDDYCEAVLQAEYIACQLDGTPKKTNNKRKARASDKDATDTAGTSGSSVSLTAHNKGRLLAKRARHKKRVATTREAKKRESHLENLRLEIESELARASDELVILSRGKVLHAEPEQCGQPEQRVAPTIQVDACEGLPPPTDRAEPGSYKAIPDELAARIALQGAYSLGALSQPTARHSVRFLHAPSNERGVESRKPSGPIAIRIPK